MRGLGATGPSGLERPLRRTPGRLVRRNSEIGMAESDNELYKKGLEWIWANSFRIQYMSCKQMTGRRLGRKSRRATRFQASILRLHSLEKKLESLIIRLNCLENKIHFSVVLPAVQEEYDDSCGDPVLSVEILIVLP